MIAIKVNIFRDIWRDYNDDANDATTMVALKTEEKLTKVKSNNALVILDALNARVNSSPSSILGITIVAFIHNSSLHSSTPSDASIF